MNITRIAITGPESTGKSLLSHRLAMHYRTEWVPEYARGYLEGLGRPYDYNDILVIARGQVRHEAEKLSLASRFLFCDTELIVTKIWCEVKYGRCHQWILDQISINPYDLYLLCNIDLPWEEDPLREHPDKRGFLFQLYCEELERRNFPYAIISGDGDKRLHQAIKVIDQTF